MPRTCVFCGGRANSREHIFRDTFRQYVPTQLLTTVTSLANPERNRRTEQSLYDRLVGAVCGDCNHGWLNDLDLEIEDSAIALFKGDRVSIGQERASRLACWAATRSAVRSQIELKRTRDSAREYCSWVVRADRPPAGVTVLLGLGEIGTGTDAFNHLKAGEVHVFQHTFLMGAALFLVTGVFASNEESVALGQEIGAAIHTVMDDSEYPMLELWPRPSAFDWPPNTHPTPYPAIRHELVWAVRNILEAAKGQTDQSGESGSHR